ncbi:putative kynurenine/alpha-aminoadipate aminotransferase, mitochondrial isoform X2 [Apostichopus japonicus]|uniref:Putative kynurenine/alpha-aminoadipate aminotransferase, mitochondrial isoform X2 n=1 Tax=Stichopus japonicus TaxID=307972 RepID=A0A2G8K8M2_STIJA|nr:putative kynurenine/alpha-aminoadipate aminotransferase, mitochondrial isoform X2 [Apostichopus japonicus]
MNYLRFINSLSQARQRSPIRLMTEILYKSPPTMISMASGMPNASQFPFEEATFKLTDGTSIEINNTDMKKALQYNPTPGIAGLHSWLMGMLQHLHKPPNFSLGDGDQKTELLITTGSQHGLCMAFEMLFREGDKVLMSSPVYSGTRSILEPYKPEYLLVESDKDGMKPESLKNKLSRWSKEDAYSDTSDIPRLLYTVPNGDNPSGVSLTLERRRDIYKICQDYNILIIEDDPYYFLQFNKYQSRFVSGPKALIYRIQLHMEASVLHSSAVSQMIIFKLLEKWGMDGFLAHSEKVAEFYQQRRDVMLRAADKWLTGLAEWNVPTGGMFLWMKLPGVQDTKDMIMKKAMKKEVLFVPGDVFDISEGTSLIIRLATLCVLTKLWMK